MNELIIGLTEILESMKFLLDYEYSGYNNTLEEQISWLENQIEKLKNNKI